jgi:anthranilate phosphoribosyltransferase
VPRPPTSHAQAAAWALEAISGRGLGDHIWLIAINGALLLQSAQIVPDLDAGYELAMEMIMSGAASRKLIELQKEQACRP